ncbi:MATE family efflux transporter [Massilibacteroides sp.]|uniref:MATE family efflux transporter n=1 Tax=Massilibacteroides sp. TaxID=2034766 RepID=UPI00260CAD61|nr:MATE family efflux transporter [Massilibacteroides sp.]MDD2496130.1 MATE family efflux transporter [Tissierellia bacterium]MDD4516005.1 MATE family efflux transporter [Massilibacteroides sp.]
MYSYKQIGTVSYPIFLSLLAQNIINVTNTAFLGHVGEVELGASAMGGLFYICAFTIAFGFSTGSQIVMARRNGEKNYEQIGPVMTQGVFFLLGLASVLFILSRLFTENLMGMVISSEPLLKKTVDFLDIRVFGFFFSFMNVMFRALYVGITRTKILTINAIIMAITNVILDYILIFGKWGMPEMGIKGAAIGSVVSEIVSILFFVTYTYYNVNLKKYGLNKIVIFDFGLLKRVLSISIFTMVQYFISMTTWFMFFVAVERIGQHELAVANIVRSIYMVLFIPINALSTTTNTFVSNSIGAGHTDQVIRIIKKIAGVSFVFMAALSAIVCLIPRSLVSIYTNDSTLIADSIPALYVISAAMLVCSIGSITFSGVSGTGNTRSALVLELITLSFYLVYLYFIAVHLRMPVEICFTTEFVYFSGLFILSTLYLKKAKWQNKRI